MKKLLLVMVTCLTVFSSLTVFGEETEVDIYSQEQFIADMQAGLEDRWSYNEDEDKMTNSEFVEYRNKLVDAEYSKLSKYSATEFETEKFNLLAHAYIDGLQLQQRALVYYTELSNLYDEMWGDGYNIRAYVIPEMVDHYGLTVEEEQIADFREQKKLIGGDYTVTTTVTGNSGNAGNIIQADNEITVFDKEGIKVVITGMEEPTLSSTKIQIRIENLNHNDIIVTSKDARMIVNGIMVDSTLYEQVASGKTANTFIEFYNDTTLKDAGIDKINELAFTIEICNSDYMPLYDGEEAHLLIDDNHKITTKEVYSDKETIQKVQDLLNSAGYDCGSADGISGKKTNNAILEFERDHNLEENTDITPELLEKLQNSMN